MIMSTPPLRPRTPGDDPAHTTLDPTAVAASRRLRTGVAAGTAGLLATGGLTAAAALLAMSSNAAAVQTIVVDSDDDAAATGTAADCTDGTTGNCSLRDAAAAATDGDTITFDPSISSIVLSNGIIFLDAVTMTGPGASALTIAGDPNVAATFYLGGNGDAVISGLTVTTRRIYSDNTGTFTLDDVTLRDSVSTGANQGYGGAFYASNDSDLEIIDCTFIGNAGEERGGAVYAYNLGAVTITGSVFSDNTAMEAGALLVSSNVTDVDISGSIFSDNTATQYGAGAMRLLNSGDASISASTIADNSIASGNGGGIYVSYLIDSLSISATTISGNAAIGNGGGIHVGGGTNAPVTITNSTLSGNSATGSGGALYVQAGPVTLEQVTIADNDAAEGGGIGIAGAATVSLSGTIVSANTATTTSTADIGIGPNAVPTISSDHSLVGTVDPAATVTDLGGTIRSTAPGLAPLADNGGRTRTMALLSTSPALDTGPDPVAPFPGNQFDQRGLGFDRVVNGTVDIGAFELQGEPVPSTTSTSTNDPGEGAVVPVFAG